MNEERLEKFKIAFGLKVKALREQKNLTQIDLASKIGVDARHIRRIETGSTNTTLTLIHLLAEAFDISAGDFF